jgi:urease accessory protein
MFDAVSPSEAALPPLQRAEGALTVTLRRREEATVLARLRQEGCLKARFPRGGEKDWREVVWLNSSGGVAAGDRLQTHIAVEAGGRGSFAAQAAERLYRALPGSPPARLRTRIRVAAGAAAEWLPQETIFFDGAALDRQLEGDLAADSWFLAVEALVFGRTAMGERVQSGRLYDMIRLRRGGRLVLYDAVRLDGPIAEILARPAVAAGAGAAATLIHVASNAETRLAALRAALDGAEAGASAADGVLLARILAADGAALRRTVTRALAALRDGRALPRVWLC